MDFPPDLTLHLAKLSESLDDGTDLETALLALADHLILMVPSFLGLTITIAPDITSGRDAPIILEVLSPAQATDVRTSLLLPLDELGSSTAGSTVILYAAQPGTFVDLAADTSYAYSLDGQVVLDRHLPGRDHLSANPEAVGHRERSTINQAIGILICRGHIPEEAPAVLRNAAARDGITVAQAAQQVLDAAMSANADRSEF